MELDLTSALVAGIPLMLIVIGVVQYVKEKLSWTGTGVEVFALLFGVVMGFLYQMYITEEIVWAFRFIFEGVIYGLAVGLVATGIYKFYHQETRETD